MRECFCSSFLAISGAYNSSMSERIRFLVFVSFLKNENNTFVSTTNFTYTNPCDFNSLNRPFRAFFVNTVISSSVNVLFLKSRLMLSIFFWSFSRFRKISRAISDQFTHANRCISSFNFASIEIVILTMLQFPFRLFKFF
jgi:hypothetical protein